MKIRAGGAERAEGHAKASLRWFDAVGSGAPAGHKAVAEAVEVVARLTAIERALRALATVVRAASNPRFVYGGGLSSRPGCGRSTGAGPGKRCSSPGLVLGDSPRSDLEPY